VFKAFAEGESWAFYDFLASGFLTSPAAFVAVQAFIILHSLTTAAVFGLVVALLWASHPGVLGAPSGDAVEPVVGRLGVSPWQVVLDGGWGGSVDLASVAAASTSVVISVSDALLLLLVPHALIMLLTLCSLLTLAVGIATIIGAWLDLRSWLGVGHAGGWLSLANSISPIQTGAVVEGAWLSLIASLFDVAPQLVAPFLIVFSLAVLLVLVPGLAVCTEVLIQLIQLRDTFVIPGTRASYRLLLLFGADHQRTQ